MIRDQDAARLRRFLTSSAGPLPRIFPITKMCFARVAFEQIRAAWSKRRIRASSIGNRKLRGEFVRPNGRAKYLARGWTCVASIAPAQAASAAQKGTTGSCANCSHARQFFLFFLPTHSPASSFNPPVRPRADYTLRRFLHERSSPMKLSGYVARELRRCPPVRRRGAPPEVSDVPGRQGICAGTLTRRASSPSRLGTNGRDSPTMNDTQRPSVSTASSSTWSVSLNWPSRSYVWPLPELSTPGWWPIRGDPA